MGAGDERAAGRQLCQQLPDSAAAIGCSASPGRELQRAVPCLRNALYLKWVRGGTAPTRSREPFCHSKGAAGSRSQPRQGTPTAGSWPSPLRAPSTVGTKQRGTIKQSSAGKEEAEKQVKAPEISRRRGQETGPGTHGKEQLSTGGTWARRRAPAAPRTPGAPPGCCPCCPPFPDPQHGPGQSHPQEMRAAGPQS